jgi:hypothetical protein
MEENMKNLLLFLGVLVFAILLVSCGKNPVLSFLPEASGTSGGTGGTGTDGVRGSEILIYPYASRVDISPATTSMTIKSGQIPFFEWQHIIDMYSTTSTNIEVSKGSFKAGSTDWSNRYWRSRRFLRSITGRNYGDETLAYAPIGGEIVAQTLTPGEYGVAIKAYTNNSLVGVGYGSFIVE